VADAPTTSLIITAIGSILSGALLGAAKLVESIAKLIEAKNGDDDDDDRHHHRKRRRRDDDDESDEDDPPISIVHRMRLAT
jgi:hypothetical protein